MLFVKTMLTIAVCFWSGPDAVKARVTAGDGVCKISRAVEQPMCGADKARAVRVAVAADEPGCDPARCDGKRCVVVCKQKQCDGDDKSGSKEVVRKTIVVREKGDGPASVVREPRRALSWCGIDDLPGCCDKGVFKKIVRMKALGCDGDGKKPSCCGDIKLGGAIELDDGILDLRACPPLGMKDRPSRIWISKRGDRPGCDGGEAPFFVKVGAYRDAEDDDPPGEGYAYVTTVIDGIGSGDVAPGGPWLGIQFGPVPKPLAAHLSLDKDAGQMVLNIVEDSPADDAGLQQYDVIIQMDGKDAPADIKSFMSAVREFEPGEKHEFALIRGGRQIKVLLVVGKRPETVGPSKYEAELEELSQADVLHHGGILRKDAEGNWKFENLGDLKEMHKLWQHLPDEQAFERLFKWSGSLPGSQCDFDIETKEGKLQIERIGDKITVTRTKIDGDKRQVTTKAYDSEEEFKKDDPEAYKITKRHTCLEFKLGKGAGCLVAPGGGVLKFMDKGSDFDINLQELMKNAAEMRKNAAEAGAEARKAYEEALHAHSEKGLDDLFGRGKAGTSFEITADGQIKVTTRKGDEELTQTYADAAALKKARPDLYEKFRRLQGDDAGSKGEAKTKMKMRMKTDD